MWKRVVTPGLILLALVACGGDSSGPSEPPFPDVAGTYQMDGGFDGLTRQQASFTGTLTVTQASREAGVLGGTAVMTGVISGQVYDLSTGTVQSASTTPGGVITVSVLSSSGAVTWTFTGTLAGNVISGRHTIASSTASSSGDWTGVRTSAAVMGSVRHLSNGGWEALSQALDRASDR